MMLEFGERLHAQAAARGFPLRPYTPESSGFAHIFPNTVLISAYGHAIIYKFRPHGLDPERCIFDIWSVSLRAEDTPPPSRPTRTGPVPQSEIPFILAQDVSNMERQQRGLRTQGFDHELISGRYEPMIINFHQALDRVLDH
jgi:hypothetical protein